MLETADTLLYARVSSDEQADGCSLEMQERYLRAYCVNHGFGIIAVYREDYSARGHDLKRPEMVKMYEYCRKHRHEVKRILFLRWDRYSRNLEFALTYKRKFYDELHIEINAIESPIDFKATEWSMLMGLYCGVAQTEDDKISRRTMDGIHGHLLKGEWTAKAPRGYKNVRKAKHDCWIEVDEAWAPTIQMAFAEVAKGLEMPNRIRKRICPTISTQSFFDMLRNKFYIGLVHVPAYGDDPEQDVVGKHPAIIDEKTFNAVQEVLGGKKKETPKLSKPLHPDLYLRKYLTCPICGYSITGGLSRGSSGKAYPYYYCCHDHTHVKARAEEANKAFVEYVNQLKPNASVLALYNEILLDIRGDCVKANRAEADRLQKELDKIYERIDRVSELFYDGEISKEEKEKNVARYHKEAQQLRDRISALRLSADLRIKEKLSYSISIIENLGVFLSTAHPEVKTRVISSIFTKNPVFDGKKYRTRELNILAHTIYLETKRLQRKTKMESSENPENSTLVPPRRIERLSSEPESEILSIKLQGRAR